MRNGVLAALLIGALGCGTKKTAGTADTLTVRQRDSVLGASQLPGAQGIRGALRASDSAAARRDREEGTGQ
jgi:hypothetical protein